MLSDTWQRRILVVGSDNPPLWCPFLPDTCSSLSPTAEHKHTWSTQLGSPTRSSSSLHCTFGTATKQKGKCFQVKQNYETVNNIPSQGREWHRGIINYGNDGVALEKKPKCNSCTLYNNSVLYGKHTEIINVL